MDVKQLQHHVYRYENAQAVTHLMRVASRTGFTDAGRTTEFWDKIETGTSLAKDSHTVSRDSTRFLNMPFMPLNACSETAVGSHAVSMGYAVAQLALQVFSHPDKLTIMIVAAGEMNSLVAKHLAEMGGGQDHYL